MKQGNEKGFTMIELLIVLVIIGIMAGLAVPRLDLLLSKDKLRASTTTVTSSLYVARMKAVNEAEPYGVQYAVDGLFTLVRDPEGANEITGAGYNLEEGISFSEINFINWLVIFNEFGQLEKSCLPSGVLTGTITLINGIIDSTLVEVTFLTGRIRETNL